MFDKNRSGVFKGTIEIIDINKLGDEMGDKTVAVEAFEGKNLVLVDEGHRGTGTAAGAALLEVMEVLANVHMQEQGLAATSTSTRPPQQSQPQKFTRKTALMNINDQLTNEELIKILTSPDTDEEPEPTFCLFAIETKTVLSFTGLSQKKT